MKESDLQIQCIDYLSHIAQRHWDLLFFSIPNERYGVSYAQLNKLKKMGLLPAMPDICILFKGSCFFIEFKAPGKKPRDDQKIIHNRINNCGFDVYVMDNFEKFQKIITLWGIA
jgi:hypothetical protein